MKKLIDSRQWWPVVLPGAFLILLYKLDYTKMIAFLGRLLAPFLLAFGLAYFLLPIKKRLERSFLTSKFKWVQAHGHPLAVALTYGEFLLFLLVFVLFVGPIVAASLRDIALQLPSFLSGLSGWIAQQTSQGWGAKLHLAELMRQLPLQDLLLPYTGQLTTKTIQGVAHMGSGVFTLITGLVLLAYMLSGHKRVSRVYHHLLRACCTPKQHLNILRYSREANRIFTSFFYGAALVSLIIGGLAAVAFSLLGLRYAVLLGLIVFVSNMIPYFGPVIGAVPILLVALCSGGISKALWTLLIILLLQQLDNNVLSPKIVGKSVGISGFWMIFVLLAGGSLFGFWGILLGVPCAACVRFIVQDLLEHS